MKIVKWLLIVAVVIGLLLEGFLWYMGMLTPIKAYESKMGPYTVAYESYVGPFSKIGPVFTKVNATLKSAGVTPMLGLGIYYDNPSQVPQDKLRSDCGAVIDVKDIAKLGKTNLKIKKIEQKNCIVAEFPLRNMLSYMFGPMKAYTAMNKYAADKGHKVGRTYEIYDEAKGKMFFVMEISTKK
ncbi:hypothetical protein HZC34_00145 [Candidatus Saganbacteria bacterium]|nr:hypothetical protein [Candidatus Saganbacteria bacterium]